MSDLISIEKRFFFLEAIDISSLELEEKVDYYIAKLECLKERLEQLLTFRNYRRAIMVEAEIKVTQEELQVCLMFLKEDLSNTDLKAYLTTKKTQPNYFRALAIKYTNNADPITVNKLHSINEIKTQLRTLMFGMSYDMKFDGYGIIIENLLPDVINADAIYNKVQEYCAQYGFGLTEGKKHKELKKHENAANLLYIAIIQE